MAEVREKSETTSVFCQSIFEENVIETLAAQHASAEPYAHVQLHDICKPEIAQKVHEEAVHNLKADFKETDLFKVFQSGDLSALEHRDSNLAHAVPTLMQFRNELFGVQFRNVVERVTQCGPLSERIDLSANAYTQGGHLLCHDDVIGTRRVAFIAYFSDPDEPWYASDGGALELYPQEPAGKGSEPSVRPSKCLLPTFNSLVLFKVMPGRSFHSIQEVFTNEKPRLSLSGWFHAPEAPEGAATDATLSQLTTRGQDVTAVPYKPLRPSNGSGTGEAPLPDHKVRYLQQFIKSKYLEEDEMNRINDALCNEQSVQLHDFLREDLVGHVTANEQQRSVYECITAADQRDSLCCESEKPPNYDAGVDDGWIEVGPPHKMRYLRLNSVHENDHLGRWLKYISQSLIQSEAFAAFLRRLTGGHIINGVAAEERRFRPGLDYTVAQKGGIAVTESIDATLCFVDSSSSETAGRWTSGEVGGFECYLEATDENEENAEVYNAENYKKTGNGNETIEDEEKEAPADHDSKAEGGDNEHLSHESAQGENKEGGDTSQLLSVHPASNTLSLVHRNEGIMRFVKFVSAQAPSSRYDICAQYTIEADDDDGSVCYDSEQ